MNIDLTAAAAKQRQKKKVRSLEEANKNIHFGLNKRGNSGTTTCKPKQRRNKAAFAFGDDEDSSSSSVDNNEKDQIGELSGRQEVNRAIAAEQEAKRKSTQALLIRSKGDATIYDYDGVFDSFSSAAKQKINSSKTIDQKKKESRYISNLLKTANQRQHEHEMIYERKVAKEQQVSEKEYIGKEKFVTKAYKRKLAERESWAKSDERLEKEQKENEIKRLREGNNSFMAGFYGNFNRNMNGNHDEDDINSLKKQEKSSELSSTNSDGNLAFLQGFEKANDESLISEETEHSGEILKNQRKTGDSMNENDTPKESIETSSKSFLLKKNRIQKILEARLRYFERIQ